MSDFERPTPTSPVGVVNPDHETAGRPGTEPAAPSPTEAGRADPASGQATGRRIGAWMIYPLVLLALASVLTLLRLSGTSVGTVRLAQPHPAADPSLVAGQPRPIRSDEWNVSTPLVVAQSHHGFGRYTVDGIGRHDLTVVLDIPNRDWSTAFKPYNLPFLVLGVEHAFAARWWLLALLVLLPSYGLILLLTGRAALAILFSLAVYLSPFFHWWYEVVSFGTVGLGLLILVCFLAAQRTPSWRWRAAWLAGAAYGLVSFALVFYPPFQVPVALVLAAVGAAYVVGQRVERGSSLVAAARDLCLVGLASGVVLGVFYLTHRTTIAAVTGTVYPGRRRISGGTGSLLQLFSSPFGLVTASHGAALGPLTNQSENSAFAMLAPFVLLQLFRMRLRDYSLRHVIPLIGACVAFAALLIWYFISLPQIVARLTLLDHAPASRSIVGIGLAGLFIVFLFLAAEIDRPFTSGPDAQERRGREWKGAGVICVLAFGSCFWIGRQYATTFPGLDLTRRQLVIISGCFAVITLLIVMHKVLAGGLALVLASAALSLSVNPIYRGLGELTASPLTTTARTLDGATHRTWLSFVEAPDVDTVLLASGVRTMNAVSLYPDAKAWQVLDPSGAQNQTWNRYANLIFAPQTDIGHPVITLVQGDVVKVDISPCDPLLDQFNVGFILSRSPMDHRCLTQVAQWAYHESPLFIYNRSSSSGG